ncbi:MAG: NAD(P)H-hydrate dehydratase [Bacteroidia bacterium]
MKILSAEQQRQADAYTIENEPIASIDLMERASKRWVDHSIPFLRSNNIYIFAGFGNNGGDGLAIARILFRRGFNCTVIHLRFDKTLSADSESNLDKLPRGIDLINVFTIADLDKLNLKNDAVLIDAIFGSGLTRPLDGDFAETIEVFNRSTALLKIAIDVPSGLFSDKTNQPKDTIAKCNLTITFQAPKLSFLFSENFNYVGEFIVANIDLHKSYLNTAKSQYNYVTKRDITPLLTKRKKYTHKGSFGHLGVIKGNYQTIGASYLAALSGFNSGTGLVSLLDFEESNNLTQWPELMHKNLAPESINHFTLCVGPGLGTDSNSIAKLKLCLDNNPKPMVVDADAINIIAKHQEYLNKVPKNSIITPHPKELERLIGKTKDSFEQLENAKEFAKKYGVILLIKRANTAIVNSDGIVYFNSTGNPGLAKAGSGDVLSGIIASFLAQGYDPIIAAKLGVYIHGKAADDLIKKTSDYSFSPQLLIGQIGKTLKRLGV